jgi:hypothetical protein
MSRKPTEKKRSSLVVGSGKVLILDPQYLEQWTTPPGSREVDVELAGPDSSAVGKLLDRQWHPRFIFDWPEHLASELVRDVETVARKNKLEAVAQVLPKRVSHPKRVDLALAQGKGAGEVQFHEILGAVFKAPPGAVLQVVAEAMPKGDPDEKRLRRLKIALQEGPVARSELFANVAVDSGRLLIIDLDAVARWQTASQQGRSLPTGLACEMATSWGDGVFETHRDVATDGSTVAVRIELGTEKRQKLMRQVEFRWTKAALVSKKIMSDGEPVRFLYREAPDNDRDSGWRMFSGTEDDEYNDDPENIAIVRLADVIEKESALGDLVDQPVGSVFERRPEMKAFERVTDWAPPE